ncbi:MAG: OmpH family outer membrane protein [Bacteroidaceae bacterium]|nr:OmpH family outer membrane protein [Bacteroidaceae bacterium]
MNRIIITFVFALCAMVCNAQEASLLSRFAYISYGEVLKSMPAYAAAQKSLADLRANYDNELKRTDEEFSKQFAEYVDGQRTFPENILLKRQKELQQLMEQGLAFKEEARRLLAQAEVELMQPVNKQLKEVIAKIAKERGYAFVLNTDNNAAPFVDGELGDDITADVMEAVK